MTELLKVTVSIINFSHDFIVDVSRSLNLNLTDKDLHFWFMGLMGMAIFLITDIVFQRIAKWNISFISFIYTVTVLIVIVFGLEIEQKITGSGNMEFDDIIAGVWGFLVIFIVYLSLRIAIYLLNNLVNRNKV